MAKMPGRPRKRRSGVWQSQVGGRWTGKWYARAGELGESLGPFPDQQTAAEALRGGKPKEKTEEKIEGQKGSKSGRSGKYFDMVQNDPQAAIGEMTKNLDQLLATNKGDQNIEQWVGKLKQSISENPEKLMQDMANDPGGASVQMTMVKAMLGAGEAPPAQESFGATRKDPLESGDRAVSARSRLRSWSKLRDLSEAGALGMEGVPSGEIRKAVKSRKLHGSEIAALGRDVLGSKHISDIERSLEDGTYAKIIKDNPDFDIPSPKRLKKGIQSYKESFPKALKFTKRHPKSIVKALRNDVKVLRRHFEETGEMTPRAKEKFKALEWEVSNTKRAMNWVDEKTDQAASMVMQVAAHAWHYMVGSAVGKIASIGVLGALGIPLTPLGSVAAITAASIGGGFYNQFRKGQVKKAVDWADHDVSTRTKERNLASMHEAAKDARKYRRAQGLAIKGVPMNIKVDSPIALASRANMRLTARGKCLSLSHANNLLKKGRTLFGMVNKLGQPVALMSLNNGNWDVIRFAREDWVPGEKSKLTGTTQWRNKHTGTELWRMRNPADYGNRRSMAETVSDMYGGKPTIRPKSEVAYRSRQAEMASIGLPESAYEYQKAHRSLTNRARAKQTTNMRQTQSQLSQLLLSDLTDKRHAKAEDLIEQLQNHLDLSMLMDEIDEADTAEDALEIEKLMQKVERGKAEYIGKGPHGVKYYETTRKVWGNRTVRDKKGERHIVRDADGEPIKEIKNFLYNRVGVKKGRIVHRVDDMTDDERNNWTVRRGKELGRAPVRSPLPHRAVEDEGELRLRDEDSPRYPATSSLPTQQTSTFVPANAPRVEQIGRSGREGEVRGAMKGVEGINDAIEWASGSKVDSNQLGRSFNAYFQAARRADPSLSGEQVKRILINQFNNFQQGMLGNVLQYIDRETKRIHAGGLTALNEARSRLAILDPVKWIAMAGLKLASDDVVYDRDDAEVMIESGVKRFSVRQGRRNIGTLSRNGSGWTFVRLARRKEGKTWITKGGMVAERQSDESIKYSKRGAKTTGGTLQKRYDASAPWKSPAKKKSPTRRKRQRTLLEQGLEKSLLSHATTSKKVDEMVSRADEMLKSGTLTPSATLQVEDNRKALLKHKKTLTGKKSSSKTMKAPKWATDKAAWRKASKGKTGYPGAVKHYKNIVAKGTREANSATGRFKGLMDDLGPDISVKNIKETVPQIAKQFSKADVIKAAKAIGVTPHPDRPMKTKSAAVNRIMEKMLNTKKHQNATEKMQEGAAKDLKDLYSNVNDPKNSYDGIEEIVRETASAFSPKQFQQVASMFGMHKKRGSRTANVKAIVDMMHERKGRNERSQAIQKEYEQSRSKSEFSDVKDAVESGKGGKYIANNAREIGGDGDDKYYEWHGHAIKVGPGGTSDYSDIGDGSESDFQSFNELTSEQGHDSGLVKKMLKNKQSLVNMIHSAGAREITPAARSVAKDFLSRKSFHIMNPEEKFVAGMLGVSNETIKEAGRRMDREHVDDIVSGKRPKLRPWKASGRKRRMSLSPCYVSSNGFKMLPIRLGRTYIRKGRPDPKGVTIIKGKYGGRYYETGSRGKKKESGRKSKSPGSEGPPLLNDDPFFNELAQYITLDDSGLEPPMDYTSGDMHKELEASKDKRTSTVKAIDKWNQWAVDRTSFSHSLDQAADKILTYDIAQLSDMPYDKLKEAVESEMMDLKEQFFGDNPEIPDHKKEEYTWAAMLDMRDEKLAFKKLRIDKSKYDKMRDGPKKWRIDGKVRELINGEPLGEWTALTSDELKLPGVRKHAQESRQINSGSNKGKS